MAEDVATCPTHAEALEKVEITQWGQILGYLWICPHNEWGSKEGECDYCLDADDEGNPIIEEFVQLDLVVERTVCDGH